ncbi:MAG: pentapeptide repeat-containing protein [Thermodesulfobacteriota bacterium]
MYLKTFDTQPAKSDPRKANLCGASLSGADLSGADLWFANLSGADLEHVNLSRAQLWGADLSGAKLLEANLSEADLSYANLSGAHLSFANLSGAHLSDANLSRAGLWGANLSRATLFKANLSGADLSDANLSGAHLSDSNLSGATLFKANLSGALLSDANLSGADLSRANLSNALFEPKNLPDADHIVFAKNLSQMSYKSNPQALVKLRKAFKDGGYYEQEREVTYSIQRSETRNLAHKRNFLSSFEAMFRYVFFDLTCQWGMAPGRALLILLTLILLFAIPYIITLRLPSQDGIWLKWADDRTRLDIGTQEPTRCYVGWVKAPTLGLYFSLLSAFNIGWREFNVGIWIQRLQTKEYTLKATGWVRTVSGLQSLISSYLLAIWVLTYFGRPFD